MNETAAQPPTIEDDEPEYDYLPQARAVDDLAQVPSYIAIIRIIAVLGMGLCISFGLFIMLVGVRGILIGVPIILLAVPCYFGMGLAEKLAMQAEQRLKAGEDV